MCVCVCTKESTRCISLKFNTTACLYALFGTSLFCHSFFSQMPSFHSYFFFHFGNKLFICFHRLVCVLLPLPLRLLLVYIFGCFVANLFIRMNKLDMEILLHHFFFIWLVFLFLSVSALFSLLF